MNSTGRYLLSLWAIGFLVGVAAAQGPETLPPMLPSVLPPGNAMSPVLVAPLAAISPDGDVATNGSGLIAGAGFYWMQPHFQNNPAYTVFVEQTKDTTLDPKSPNTKTLGETARRVDVKHHMVMAPLLWLGYVNDAGFGGRVRGWGFQEGTSQTEILAPFSGQFKVGGQAGQSVIVASGTLVTASSAAPLGLQAFADTLSIQHGPEATALTVTTKLSVQVGDLEVLQRFREADWSFLVAGGVRYVHLGQTYNAYDAQSTSAAELRTLLSTYQFDGLGPTLALELRRAIADTGVGVYGQARGSLVFGSADQSAMFFGQELRNDDPNPQLASQQRDRAIPIIDFEAGLEYGRPVGRAWLFGQVGVVGQQWFNAGSASRSTNMNPATTLRPVLGGAPIDSNIAFLGLTFHVGVNY